MPFSAFLHFCSLRGAGLSSPAQLAPPDTGTTRDFTDRPSFNAASGGLTKTVGFTASRDAPESSRGNPLTVSGVKFSTSTPSVTVNATRADIYHDYPYPADFLVNSVVGTSTSSASNNDLTITFPCPTLAIGMDFGGLGTDHPGSATIMLSNGHSFKPGPLPTAGHTTFVGFVSSAPITGLTLNTVGDSWVLQDVVVGNCYGASPPLPTVIEEQEGPFVAMWSQDGQGFRARWNNGATATLTVQSFTPASVIVSRTDLPNSTSAGMTAIYSGEISGIGDSIVNGKVTWNWPGHAGYPYTGTWTASWTSPPPPTVQQQTPQDSGTAAVSSKEATVVSRNPAVGTAVGTNSCVIQPYKWNEALLATPLRVAVDYLSSKNLHLAVAPDGKWVPLTKTFTADSNFPNLYSVLRSPSQTTYDVDVSQDGYLTIKETGSSNSLIAGSGMTALTGSENWNATQTVNLNSGKDTLKFTASLNAQYIGGSQQKPGKSTNCTINLSYSGEYDVVDMISFATLTCDPLRIGSDSVEQCSTECGADSLPPLHQIALTFATTLTFLSTTTRI